METFPEIGVSDDRGRLIPDEGPESRGTRCRSWCLTYRWCVGILLILSLILLGHALAIYYLYFKCNSADCIGLKIMTLNTWGMPKSLGSQFKEERMLAIGHEIAKGQRDLYLLEELWMEPDYETIRASLPAGYHMTLFRQLALSTCDGHAGPEFCSGLSVISRFPLLETEFNSYTYHGDPLKAWIDGEWLARKGVGRVRIQPLKGLTVDLFVTHTAADPDPSHGYNNSYYRVRQVQELMDNYVKKATADVVLLGGDFNAGPNKTEGEPYGVIRGYMKNSIEEFFYKLLTWLNPQYATYGNTKNTFSNTFLPIIYDYIFYHARDESAVNVWTNLYEMPFFKFFLQKDHAISFSDHEAVEATVYVQKLR